MPEERKLVTVLFADIVGSTAIAGSHDPEVIRRTLSRTFGEVRRILEAHGGTVEKFIGDAVMAVFGIPRSHDDDADRAVRAAFALRDRIAELNAEGRFSLELRIGVNSGQVVTGDASETLVTGGPVNAGSRVQAAAAPNEILVGEMTYRLTDRAVRYGARREIEAKGIGRITVWPAAELASALPAQHRGVAGLHAPLIGRDDELRLLVDSHRKVAGERRAALVTIFGSAGVGKSRLVGEFVDAIGSDRVRRGRCLPYGEGITFWPVVEILRADAGITAVDSHEDATRKLRAAVLAAFGGPSEDADAIARRLSVLAGTARREDVLDDVPAESVQAELRWGLRRYLERRADDGPMTVIFDDIHWAEVALLDLIEHLAEWSRAPVFILCMARPDLREVRPGWGGGLTNASAIRLEPLNTDESARLIGELLDIDALPWDIRQKVIARSEGNPLYVEEFLRMLLDAGHIAKRGDRFVATESIETLVVPATLQGLLAARLDGTPPTVKRVLQHAAIVGKVFWPESILAQTSIDGRLEDHLIDAAQRDLVSELDERGLGGGRAWTFKHILIRDVAYDAIPKVERSRAHDAFGRWLGSAAGERLGEYAEIVAHHAEQAFVLAHELGEPDAPALGERAFRLVHDGGTKAHRRGDRRGSLALFRRALWIAEAVGLPAATRLEAQARVASARMALDDSQEVLEEIRVLVPALREIAPTAVLVELLRVLSFDLCDTDADTARTLDGEAVAVARAVGDPELVAAALLNSAWVWWVNGDMEAQRQVLVEANDYIDAVGAPEHLSEVLLWRAANAAMSGRLVEVPTYAERADARAVASGSSAQRAMAMRGLVISALWRGDLDTALAIAKDALAFAVDTGSRSHIGENYWYMADALAAAGDLEAAQAAYERSIEELAGAFSRGLRAEARTRRAKLLVRLGRIEEARIEAETARAEVEANDVLTVATSATALAAVRAAEGQPDEADRLYREGLASIGRTGYKLPEANLRSEYATFLIDVGRGAEAVPMLQQVRAFYDSPVTPFKLAGVDALLARCTTVTR